MVILKKLSTTDQNLFPDATLTLGIFATPSSTVAMFVQDLIRNSHVPLRDKDWLTHGGVLTGYSQRVSNQHLCHAYGQEQAEDPHDLAIGSRSPLACVSTTLSLITE